MDIIFTSVSDQFEIEKLVKKSFFISPVSQ